MPPANEPNAVQRKHNVIIGGTLRGWSGREAGHGGKKERAHLTEKAWDNKRSLTRRRQDRLASANRVGVGERAENDRHYLISVATKCREDGGGESKRKDTSQKQLNPRIKSSETGTTIKLREKKKGGGGGMEKS